MILSGGVEVQEAVKIGKINRLIRLLRSHMLNDKLETFSFIGNILKKRGTAKMVMEQFDNSEIPLFHWSVILQRHNFFSYLVQKIKVNPLLKDGMGQTVAHRAASDANIFVLDYFVTNHINLWEVDDFKRLPIQIAHEKQSSAIQRRRVKQRERKNTEREDAEINSNQQVINWFKIRFHPLDEMF